MRTTICDNCQLANKPETKTLTIPTQAVSGDKCQTEEIDLCPDCMAKTIEKHFIKTTMDGKEFIKRFKKTI